MVKRCGGVNGFGGDIGIGIARCYHCELHWVTRGTCSRDNGAAEVLRNALE